MSSSSQSQVRRLLSLVPYLMEHDGVSVADVADTFGITPQRLREDLHVLWMCGLPGLAPGDLIEIDMDAVEGEGVIHLSNADYLTRPLRLAADEALALVLALRTLSEVAGPQEQPAIDRALVKLQQAAGLQTRTAQASVTVTAADEAIRAQITDALERHKRLSLTYDVASRSETTFRMVDPLRLIVVDGYAYLEAWCYRSDGVRLFRLDRMVDAEVTDIDAVPHDVQLKDLSGGWFDALADAPLVTVELQPAAAWVAEYYPVEQVTTASDGRLTVSLRVTDPSWLQGLLLRLGADARVVSPPGAEEAAIKAAEQTLALYRQPEVEESSLSPRTGTLPR